MGTWGTGIFDNDTTADLRGDFEDLLAEGLGVEAATERVVADYADALDDYDEGPMVRLALAALQLEHGSVQPAIREQALAVIEGGDAPGWREADPEVAAERRRVLDDLRARLMSS